MINGTKMYKIYKSKLTNITYCDSLNVSNVAFEIMPNHLSELDFGSNNNDNECLY